MDSRAHLEILGPKLPGVNTVKLPAEEQYDKASLKKNLQEQKPAAEFHKMGHISHMRPKIHEHLEGITKNSISQYDNPLRLYMAKIGHTVHMVP